MNKELASEFQNLVNRSSLLHLATCVSSFKLYSYCISGPYCVRRLDKNKFVIWRRYLFSVLEWHMCLSGQFVLFMQAVETDPSLPDW